MSYAVCKNRKGTERARGLIPSLCAPPPCHYATERKTVGRLPLPPGNSPGLGMVFPISKYVVGGSKEQGQQYQPEKASGGGEGRKSEAIMEGVPSRRLGKRARKISYFLFHRPFWHCVPSVFASPSLSSKLLLSFLPASWAACRACK